MAKAPKDPKETLDKLLTVECRRLARVLGLDTCQIIATTTTEDGDTTRWTGHFGNQYAIVAALEHMMEDIYNGGDEGSTLPETRGQVEDEQL